MANLLNRPCAGLIGKFSAQVYFRNYAIGTDIENQVKSDVKKQKNWHIRFTWRNTEDDYR